MTHFPGHLRSAFTDWIEADCPMGATVVEHGHQLHEISGGALCAWLRDSTDVLPKESCQGVADHLGFDGDLAGMSYGDAANALITEFLAEGAGARFIELLDEASLELDRI